VLERFIELDDAGHSTAEIRHRLHAEKLVASTHRESFRRLLDRLGVTFPPSAIRAVLLGNPSPMPRT
jgi:hypothetical protein